MRIKKTLQPLEYKGNIIFGAGNKNIVRHIPNTKINRLLIQYLDGQIKRSELEISDSELEIALGKFKKLGLLTNNPYNSSDRYSRNANFFEWLDTTSNLDPFVYQKRLESSVVLIIGLGGIGSTVAEELVRSGVKNLVLVDYDSVDESNISRQSTYCNADVGTLKIKACASYLKKIDNKLSIETINKKICTIDDLKEMVSQDINLIINCADTPKEIDIWADKVSSELKIPVVFGSYASTTINTIAKIPDYSVDIKDFLASNAITSESIISTDFDTAVISPVTFMAAGMVGYYAVMILTKLRRPSTAIQIDLDGWEVLKYDIRAAAKD
ncbi:hypothetical protein LFYK43_03150 [Ligilactobacillus salitolerans]|uniref:THIF-type NAD/FAD binding fold domain-containing protein n=1 Tax=Ligilactobacillus salitolerans TaxID=1808352 RepID=A0A401IQQ2_9LACO|nr:ThiF family adenylyltransferase [Ligilactobacillus salitolerans]GBG93856.1 hypothetical protein LFYK43_03150 [Ligilactobacillus salitolerans]